MKNTNAVTPYMIPIFLWSTVVNQLQKPVSADGRRMPRAAVAGIAHARHRTGVAPSRQALRGRPPAPRSRRRSGGSRASSSRASPRSGSRATPRAPPRSTVSQSQPAKHWCVGSAKCVRFGAGVHAADDAADRVTRRARAPVTRQRVHEQVHPLARRAGRSASTAALLLVGDPRLPVARRRAPRRAPSSWPCCSPQNSAHWPKYVPGSSACTGCGSSGPGRRPACRPAPGSRTSGSPGSPARRSSRRRSARPRPRARGRPSRSGRDHHDVGDRDRLRRRTSVVMSSSVYSNPHHHW